MIFIFIRFKTSMRKCAMQIKLSSRVITKNKNPEIKTMVKYGYPCREIDELGLLWSQL